MACLLYMIEDLSLDQEPKIQQPGTSQQQAWGKGKRTELDPAPVFEKTYSKKRDQDRYLRFDPRPENAPPADKDKFLRGLQELKPLPATCMWEKLLVSHMKRGSLMIGKQSS